MVKEGWGNQLVSERMSHNVGSPTRSKENGTKPDDGVGRCIKRWLSRLITVLGGWRRYRGLHRDETENMGSQVKIMFAVFEDTDKAEISAGN